MLGLHFCKGFSLVVQSRGASVVVCAGFSLQRLLLVWSTGSRMFGLQLLPLLDSRAQAQNLWCLGLAAPQHVGSSQVRD